MLQFAAQPVSPQMLLVSSEQIEVNILIWTVIADSGCVQVQEWVIVSTQLWAGVSLVTT